MCCKWVKKVTLGEWVCVVTVSNPPGLRQCPEPADIAVSGAVWCARSVQGAHDGAVRLPQVQLSIQEGQQVRGRRQVSALHWHTGNRNAPDLVVGFHGKVIPRILILVLEPTWLKVFLKSLKIHFHLNNFPFLFLGTFTFTTQVSRTRVWCMCRRAWMLSPQSS